MRARILWAATLAVLLFGLAVGPSAGAGGPAPSVPSSSWAVVASMPQDLYGAAAASNGIFSYAAGGYSTSTGTTLDTFYRYNPVNERWETRAGDARRGGHGLGGLLPDLGQDLRVRRLRSEHRRVQRRDQGLRPDDGHLGFGGEHAGPARLHGLRLQRRERQDLPGRRLRRRRPGQRAGDDVGVRPCGEHVHHARADSARRRRHGLRRDRRPPLSGRRPRCARRRGGSGLGLQHRREQLDGQGRHAEPDERRGQRRRERQALELRRRGRFGPGPDDRGLRPGDRHLGERSEPERGSHARGRNGDRHHARGRRRVRGRELNRQDRGAGRG